MKQHIFIREQAYTIHQKIMLIGFSVISLMIFIQLIQLDLNLMGYLVTLFFLIVTSFFLALGFSSKALIKKKGKLYKGKSIFGFVLFKKKIGLVDRTVVSILKFKKNQKFAFVSAASPNQADSFNSFEIFVLNEKHTKRESVLYFTKERNAEQAINFLVNDFPLKHEVFSPDFNKKTEQ